jgi:HEAT repeat protein
MRDLGSGDTPTHESLLFLSDLSQEDRETFRQLWPAVPVERRREIVEMLAAMAEENIELFFRRVFLEGLEDGDAQVRASAIEGLFEDNSRVLLGRLTEMVRRDPSDDVREAAATALGRFTYLSQCDKLGNGSEAAMLRAALLESARDEAEEEDVRRRSIEALGYLADDTEIQDLIAGAYETGGQQAESALFAMGRNMDPRWQPTVLNELESQRPAMRYEAARAAGEMALEDALPLLTRLIDDPDLEVRLAAVWALGQVGGKPAAEALVKALRSDNPAMREAAQEAMEEIAFSANPLNIV